MCSLHVLILFRFLSPLSSSTGFDQWKARYSYRKAQRNYGIILFAWGSVSDLVSSFLGRYMANSLLIWFPARKTVWSSARKTVWSSARKTVLSSARRTICSSPWSCALSLVSVLMSCCLVLLYFTYHVLFTCCT